MSPDEEIIDDELEQINKDFIVNNIPVIIFIAIVCIIGIVGNSVAFAFYRTRISRSVNNVFLTVLSLNDLLTSVILLDLILDVVYSINFTSEIGCKILTSINRIFITSSFLLIFLIAVDRFLTVFLKMPRIMFSIRSAKNAILAMYIINILTTVPEFIITEPIETIIDSAVEGNVTTVGFNCRNGDSNDKHLQTVMKGLEFAELSMVILCLLLIVVIYSLIAIKVACVKRKLYKHSVKSRNVLQTDQKYRHSNHVHESATNNDTNVEQNLGNVSIDGTEGNGGECATKATYSSRRKYDEETTVEDSDEATAEMTKLETISTVQNVSCMESHDPAKIVNHAEMPKIKFRKKVKTKTTRNRNTERRITLMMFVMTLASVLSFAPYYAILLGSREKKHLEYSIWKRIFFRSFLFNSSINPFVIGYFNPKLRKYVNRCVLRIKH